MTILYGEVLRWVLRDRRTGTVAAHCEDRSCHCGTIIEQRRASAFLPGRLLHELRQVDRNFDQSTALRRKRFTGLRLVTLVLLSYVSLTA